MIYPLTAQEVKDYATDLIHDHARDIEFLTVFEMFDDWTGNTGGEISEEDARRVHDVIHSARVEVSWE